MIYLNLLEEAIKWNNPVPQGFKVYLDEEQIIKIADDLADKVNRDCYDDKSVVLSVLNGATLFTADLTTRLKFDIALDFVKVASRGINIEGDGTDAEIKYHHDLDIFEKDIIITDEMYDTGKSLKELIDYLLPFKPKSITIVVAFRKIGADEYGVLSQYKHYIGIDIPLGWYIGYGLDGEDGKYRNRRCLYKKI